MERNIAMLVEQADNRMVEEEWLRIRWEK